MRRISRTTAAVSAFALCAVLAYVISRQAGATPKFSAQDRPGTASSAAGVPAGGAAEPAGHQIGLVMAMPSTLGQVLTDDYMMTLYRSDKDSPAPSASTCGGECLTRWLPALAAGQVTFADGDQSLVATLARPDGTRQLTLKGWPLYRFAGDRAEGDTRGQGSGGTWFAIAPDGEKAKALARIRDSPGR
jgi:predicted lipoprotein with Yx(FWY)xxD motif